MRSSVMLKIYSEMLDALFFQSKEHKIFDYLLNIHGWTFCEICPENQCYDVYDIIAMIATGAAISVPDLCGFFFPFVTRT